MLKLNVNQEKQLTFEVQIGGVQSDQVSSHLRIEIDDVEYGFPAEIGRESITVNLPALRTITAKKLKEGQEVSVKLEIIADGNYLTPWQDTFRLSNPLVVEAKIVDDEFNAAPAFKTKLVSTKGKAGEQSQGVMIEQVEVDEPKNPLLTMSNEDDITEKIVNKLAEKISKLNESKNVEEACKMKEEDEEGKESEMAEEPEEEVKESKKITTKEGLREFIKNIDKEGIYEYMRRVGTKSKMVQDIIYEQAKSTSKSQKPIDIFREVITLLKKG